MSDDNLERITILLQAKDRDFARAMDRNNKLIAKMSRDARRNTTAMSRTVEGNLSRMAGSVSTFGRAFVGGLAGGAITAAFGMMTTNLAQTVRGVASVGDEARRSGLGVEAFQEWGFVAQQNRIGIDQLVDGFKELNLRADEFITTGGGSAAEAFARLGYDSASLARGLEDPSELMLELIGRMEDLDSAAQIRVADEVFGGSAGERFVELLGQGERGLRRTIAAAHDAGAVLDSELIQRATLLDQKFSELSGRVRALMQTAAVGLFAGGVETSADALERIFGTLERARATLGDGIFDALITDAGELDDTTTEALSAISLGSERAQLSIVRVTASMSDVTGQLADLGRVDDLINFDTAIAALDQLVVDFRAGTITADEFDQQLRDAVTNATQALIAVNEIDGVDVSNAVAAISGLTGELIRARAEAQALSADLPGDAGSMTTGTPFVNPNVPFMPPTTEAPTTSPRPRAAPTGDGLGYTPPPSGGSVGGAAAGYAASVADIQARTRALELEAAALVAVAAGGQDYGDAAEYARTRAELLNQALAEGRTITPELQAEIDALAGSYVTAGQSAEDAADRMDRVRENAERGADAMTDLFMGIAEGGDAAREAIARLLLELARVQMSRALSGLAGSGGGGLIGMLGGLLSGNRASGGPVAAGQAYLVNENTPNSEVFVPSRSGGVLNVAQAKDALRGQSGGGAVEPTRVVISVQPSGEFDARVSNTAAAVVNVDGPRMVQSQVSSGGLDQSIGGRFGTKVARVRR